MKNSFLLPALLSAALTLTVNAAGPDDLRAEAEKLVERAKQAKSEGRGDEAVQIMGRVKQIQGELREQLAASGGAKPGDGQEKVRRQIEELHRAGKHEEAQQLEKKCVECNGPNAEGPERLRHVMQAIEHLRAAGFNEQAEGLVQVANKMRKEAEHQDDSAKSFKQQKQEDPLREVRDTVIQLRGQMEKMQRQLEEMRGQAGKPPGDKERR